ncbi:Helix-turn-helix domain-containing protein [Solimonas aquatica]|uniref:Helix-turn-helix domain-containing protein n=1 Tax=Solimonas aquatica TaxID=489703 RepID=A0A1H9BBC1_9GAMM|nr:AraC family transcriptional regulator [Solimonas aquatica]SEP86001.1 Helix-turn-helix domain-containing protein [Solimonas aquatica]
MSGVSHYRAVDAFRSRITLHPESGDRSLQQAGLSVHSWNTPWIQQLELPANDELVIAVHRDGRCNVRALRDDVCSCEQSTPGQLTCMPPGLDWAFRVEGAVRFETLHIPRERINSIAKRHSLEGHLPDFRFAFCDAFVGGCLDAIHAEARNPGAKSEDFVRSVTDSLLLHVLRNSSSSVRDAALSLMGAIERSRALIEESLSECLSLEELAEEAGISRSHFARRFRAEIGVSPHRYQSQRRVEMAKRMLRETGMPLVDIAIELGFCSQSHFTQVFRSHTGMTPRRYREG